MTFITGSLGSSGRPYLTIYVRSEPGGKAQQFEALIDTGFTGFLMMPGRDARRMGLNPDGVMNFTLADGSGVPLQMSVGYVELPSGEIYKGAIVLGNAAHALLGMQFLRKAGKGFYVDRQAAVLMNEVSIEILRRKLSTTG